MKRSLMAILAIVLCSIPATTAHASKPTVWLQLGSRGDQVKVVQQILVDHDYVLAVDGIFGLRTERVVKKWQASNRLLQDGIVGPVTMFTLVLSTAVNGGLRPAVRLNPPQPPPEPAVGEGLNGMPFAPAGLDACQEMNFYRVQAGLPDRFDDSGRHQRWTYSDGIGWAESKCSNSAANSCCLGYWQNYLASHLRSPGYRDRIINECQVTGRNDILGEDPLQKQKSACVTKVVFDVSGVGAWRKNG